MLEFRVLGPLEALRDGKRLDLGRRRERALAGALLLSANRVVSADRLVVDLWGPEPPPAAASALRVHVSRLRRVLGGENGEVLATRAGGYVLHVGPGALDAAAFEQLTAAGRAAASAGEHVRAAADLRAALALWRGPAFGDLVDLPFADAEAARLEEGRLSALEDRVAADLACGRHREVAGDLDALTAEHPLRERFWELRMLSLYRSGRQADALSAFQALRRRLDAELGIAPGPTVRALEGAILRQDPALDAPTIATPAITASRPMTPDPAAAHVVEWRQASGPAKAPLPAALVRSGRIFVGRDAELGLLRGLWAEAREERRIALVAGEPGIGKTRLAAELAAGLPDDALVLAGRCDEDLGMPYQPFVEALRHYVAHAGPGPELGRYAGELTRLVPELSAAAAGLPAPLRADPQTEQYRLFDAVAAWLSSVSAKQVVLLVLDDLHWAAKPTLLMLRHLLRFGEPLRMLVVVTYRDTDVRAGHPLADWTADLRRETGVERIPLTGLDAAGVDRFVAAAKNLDRAPDAPSAWADERAPSEFARLVWRETEGNPFFVAEVLRHLVESGALARRGDTWVATVAAAELGIPDGVREVVGRRLGRLSPVTNRVLSIAAVVGAEFDPAVVRHVAEIGEDDLFDALDEAVGARLLTEPASGYRFAHALVRTTVHDALGAARRVALHGRVAEAIEAVYVGRLDEHLSALAHHCAQAGSPRAVEYATRAGHRALAQLAHDEAAAAFRQALDLMDPGDVGRCLALLLDLGEAQRRAGDAAHRDTLLAAADLARRRGDAASLARAALSNARTAYFSFNGVDHDRVAVLEAALAVVPESDAATRARLMATLAVELHWEPDASRRMDLSDRALALARACGERATLAHVLLARPLAILAAGTLGARLHATAEFLAVAAEVDDPVLRCWADCLRSRTLLEVGDLAGVNRHIDAFVAGAEALRQPVLRWTAACSETGRLTLAGRLAEAEERAVAALAVGRDSGQPEAALNFWAQMFLVRFHQGRLEDMDLALAESEAMERLYPVTVTSLAFFHCETGDLTAARLTMQRAEQYRLAQPTNLLWPAMVMYAGAAVALGDATSGARLFDVLAPFRDQVAVMGAATFGSVAHWLGLLARMLGRLDEADADFAAAAAMHERLESPPWLARTQLEWGQALLAGGRATDADRGRDLLRRALATAREFGLGAVDRRASALLA